MPITDLDLANACLATYAPGAIPTWNTSTCHVFRYVIKGVTVIAFEGTSSLSEWGVDFEALPVEQDTFDHADLGIIHRGWWKDIEPLANDIIALLKTVRGPMACTGHSKGAAEALIFAALAKTQGIQWLRVSTFGTPHPGSLKGLITPDLGADYRNMTAPADPIPEVPFYLPRPRPITEIHAPSPQFNDPNWLFVVSHHIQNYIAAIKNVEA